ncbi:hypothetical protein [Cedecea sp. NFIX57]|uniref:hypothetical protein n=1 Tax=Cedecea sp. NFIX57 TaxID=1566286 RepID=UPI0020CAFECB|nr:hypothetical protein [Cedecea sp. NFIX57]
MISSLSSDFAGCLSKKQVTHLEKLTSAEGRHQDGRACQPAESLLHRRASLICIRKLFLYGAPLSPFRMHFQQLGMQREVADDHPDGILQIWRKVPDIDEVKVFHIVFPLQEDVLRIDAHRSADGIPVFNTQPGTATHQVFKVVKGHWRLPRNVFVSQSLMMDFFPECLDSGVRAFFYLVQPHAKKCTWLHFFRQSHLKSVVQ